jgi:hypothetical protein
MRSFPRGTKALPYEGKRELYTCKMQDFLLFPNGRVFGAGDVAIRKCICIPDNLSKYALGTFCCHKQSKHVLGTFY